MNKVQNQKVAIVTGGAGDVGAATAEFFASRRYHVLINYNRSKKRAEEVVEICKSYGVESTAICADVSSNEGCQEVAKAANDAWGRIDVLVNSAGATQFIPLTQLDDVQAEDFLKIYSVNAVGPFLMARAVSKFMKEAGSIVNISSIAGETGRGSSYPYVLSKSALNILTVSLARSLAPKIRVNAVMPGMIEGKWMLDGLGEDSYNRVKKDFIDLAALGKICRPQDIAGAAFWLSDPDSVVTGQVIKVDAGFTLGRDRNQSR